MASPNIVAKLKSFADKISGTSYVDNGTDPNSAAYKMSQSVGKPSDSIKRKAALAKQVAAYKPTSPVSNGIGVGP